jgi:hypothetical protein
MHRLWPALAIAAGATLFGCTPSFQAASEVTDLRVLAISAEPPEAFVDLQAKTVQPVHVRMLVVDPNARGAATTDASLCFPTDDRLCSDPRIDLPQQQGNVGEVAFDVQPTPELAALIVGALNDDKLKGLGGIRVQFSASVADGDPHGPVTASKTLLFSAQPPDKANHSPRIAHLKVVRGDGTVEVLEQGASLLLQRFEEVGLLPVLGDGPDGSETYTTTDLSGNQVQLTEQPAYAFFAVIGCDFDKDKAYEPLPTDPVPGFGLVRMRSYLPGTGTFWVVVRDGRGGESWFSATWSS